MEYFRFLFLRSVSNLKCETFKWKTKAIYISWILIKTFGYTLKIAIFIPCSAKELYWILMCYFEYTFTCFKILQFKEECLITDYISFKPCIIKTTNLALGINPTGHWQLVLCKYLLNWAVRLVLKGHIYRTWSLTGEWDWLSVRNGTLIL